MSKTSDHHLSAARHSEHGANHHKEAAKHEEAGAHEQAAHNAYLAHGHSQHAAHHCSEAAKQHADHCDTKAKAAPATAPEVTKKHVA